METMRDIKRRINSVKNTQKITRAMKMVAAAKLRKAQEKAEASRPFFNKTRDILSDVFIYTNDLSEHPLLVEREGNRDLYILITSDRGLSGAYNAKAISMVEENIDKDREINLLTIGKKGRDYFARRGYNIISEYIQIDDYPNFGLAKKIADEVISLFTADIVDRVYLVYTHFNSVISQTTKLIPLLPVISAGEKKETVKRVEYLYEPSPDVVLDILLPKYVSNIMYSAILESKASEFGSRMTAMDSATDNASELIDALTLSYNRARQAAITTEISEIVGGAEALK